MEIKFKSEFYCPDCDHKLGSRGFKLVHNCTANPKYYVDYMSKIGPAVTNTMIEKVNTCPNKLSISIEQADGEYKASEVVCTCDDTGYQFCEYCNYNRLTFDKSVRYELAEIETDKSGPRSVAAYKAWNTIRRLWERMKNWKL